MAKTKTLVERAQELISLMKKGAAKNAEHATADGQTLTIDSAGADIAVGDSVSIAGQPAPDKEYKLTTGKTVVVVAGKVAEVKPAEAAAAPKTDEPAPAASTDMAPVLEAIATSMQAMAETMQAIQAKQKESDTVLASTVEAVELIGTSMSSGGFKSVPKPDLTKGANNGVKTADEQRDAAIQANREKRMNFKKDAGK